MTSALVHSLVTIGRACAIGAAWAAAWTPVGMLLGTWIVGELEPEHIGGSLYPSFICGTVFGGLAGTASGRRRINEMPAFRAATWGTAAGVFVGLIPFAAGEGDFDRYQNEWKMTIIGMAVVVASMAAHLRWLGGLTAFRAAILAFVIATLVVGLLPVLLSGPKGLEPWSALVIVAALCPLLGGVSGFLSPPIARWWKKQDSVASLPAR